MGNKSKRRQGNVFIMNAEGYICGMERRDIGYGRRRKNHRPRERNTETVIDFETFKRLRREARRAKKDLNSASRHEQPIGGAAPQATEEHLPDRGSDQEKRPIPDQVQAKRLLENEPTGLLRQSPHENPGAY